MDRATLLDAMEKSPNFPKIPKELSDIINILQEPQDAIIDDIVDRINLVEGLESMIIDFINSEFFKAPKKVTSLKEAIVFLGMKTMQVIIIATIINYLFSNEGDRFGEYEKESYLKHSIGTALASISIAEWLGKDNKYELFAYGMLHDIGVVLYENCFPELFGKIQEMISRGNHQIVAEKIVLGGLDHTDIGSWVCDKLNFPPNISDVVISHHWPSKAKNQNKMIYIINLGDYISTKYYEGFLMRINWKKPIKLRINNSLNIPEEVLEEVRLNLPKEVEKTLRLFKRF
ncbi:MAG TPA: HDOD domain-containing protein [Clostridia bacterium]|nr:HDOD domain-containing protein [Clostridia bacterium]